MSLVRVPAGVALVLLADWERMDHDTRADVMMGSRVAAPHVYGVAAQVPLHCAQEADFVVARIDPALFARCQNDCSSHDLGWAGDFGATKGARSMSVGDVVRLDAENWFVCAQVGWKRCPPEQAADLEGAFGNALEPGDAAARVSAAPATGPSADITIMTSSPPCAPMAPRTVEAL